MHEWHTYSNLLSAELVIHSILESRHSLSALIYVLYTINMLSEVSCEFNVGHSTACCTLISRVFFFSSSITARKTVKAASFIFCLGLKCI